MDSVDLNFSRDLFEEDVIARTAHRYTANYFVEMRVEGDYIHVVLTPKVGAINGAELAQRFRNDALDDRLRAVVSAQTSALQVALTSAALGAAQPRERSDS